MVVEQMLNALVEQWQRAPVEAVLFPPGAFGDELATRLAQRIHGASTCQAISFDISAASVRRSY